MFKNTHNTCPIKFSDTFIKGEDNYHVFEVNEQLISTLLQEGTFQIKGNTGNDDAILTTTNKSYKLQKRLFSNSFLFSTHEPASSEGGEHLEVHTLKDYLLEVIPHAPQYDQVCNFLYNARIKEEDDMNLMEAGHLFDDLLTNFQISEEELKNMLQRINACNIGNRWFLVDEGYLINVFHEILFGLRAGGYNFEEIPYPHLIDELHLNRPRDIVLNAMQNYMELTNKVGDQLMFRLNFEFVCKVFAKQLLLTKDNYFYDEFREGFQEAIAKFCPGTLYESMMEEEKERIESTCFTSFAMLVEENNLSLKNYSKERVYIKYVNKMLLPADFKGRLKKLFKLKNRYFYEELVQWLKDLVNSTKELDELLLKNTRAVNEKLSKAIYPIFADYFKMYMKNVSEDQSSKGQFYDVKFYLSK